MSAPFILSDQGDVAVFETARDLERYVESPDVAAYRIYDASGLRYFFKGSRDLAPDGAMFQVVKTVHLDEENPGHEAAEELKELLRRYLRRVECHEPSEALSLPQLLQKTIETCGYTR